MIKRILTGMLFCATALTATEGKVKKYNSYNDFFDGTFKNVTLSSTGALSASSKLEKWVDFGTEHVWHLAVDNKTVYAACGAPAKLFRIENEDTSLVFSSDAAAIFALAIDRNGGVWFSPSPGGDLYRYQNNATEKITSLEVTYIWDILPLDKSVLLATGTPGLILEWQQSGQIDTVFSGGDEHIRVLTLAEDDGFYAGSADNGLVYKFDAERKPFIVYDADDTEIFNILPTTSGIWLAAMSEGIQRPRVVINRSNGDSNGSSSASAEIARISTNSISSASRSGSVYQLNNNGTAQNFWSNIKDRVQSMLTTSNEILVGTGDDGRLYLVKPDQSIELLNAVSAGQITALEKLGSQIILATSNSGNLFRFDPKNKSKGSYQSPVLDCNSFSRWGSLSWEGVGSPHFFIRSGNVEEPNKTWSEWQPVDMQNRQGTMSAPVARFVQWRADLDGQARISQVQFGYQQQNIAPMIHQINVHPHGEAYPEAVEQGIKAGDKKDPGNILEVQNNSGWKKVSNSGYKSISWTVNDDNDDPLLAAIYHQLDGTSVWRKMVDNYAATVFSFDTRTLEDGVYFFKVEINDHVLNPGENGFKHEKVSSKIVVDNTGPDIQKLRESGDAVTFSALDQFSRIEAAEYAFNAGDWQLAIPADGIFDTRQEQVEISCAKLQAGEHLVMVKVEDERGNTSYKHITIKRK